MTTRALALAALVAALAAPPSAARAQTKADAFAGKIPPVSGQLYRKAGRLELTATGNLSLNDAFFRKTLGGLKLGYHLSESWSFAAQAAAGMASPTGSATVCATNGGCVAASESMLRQVPGRVRAIAGLELAWAPVYGKLNVLSERVAHFDLSVLGGADVVAHDEIVSRSVADELELSGGEPALTTAFGGHLGLGARLFLAEWLALRLEAKGYAYPVTVPNAGTGTDWQFQFMSELGLSFFLPPSNRPISR